MKTHYDHYLVGCREAGVKPISFWRFSIAYGKYQREFREKLEQHWDGLSPRERHLLVIECQWLVGIANLVRQGEHIALSAAQRGNDDEPGTASAGTREPRIPLTPVLVGCAARPLPTENSLKETYHWRL